MGGSEAPAEAEQKHKGLRARDLRKHYGTKITVNRVSVDVSPTEIVGLLGPNGAGKTATFYMMVRLIRADAGQVLVGDTDVTNWPMHKRAALGISYLPQEASIFRRLTVADNIRAILQLQSERGRPLSRQQVATRLEDLAEQLKIVELLGSPAVSLSGGERRRVEIARALATNPKFLLLDEPFAGIDPIAVIEIQRIVRELKARGIGVLITDHNVREALGICDRAYILSEGKVLDQGIPEKIIVNPRVREVYLGENFRM